MKTADLIADHRTDALVALARGKRFMVKGGTFIVGPLSEGSAWIGYSPSTVPAQWAELIEPFVDNIKWSGIKQIAIDWHVRSGGHVKSASTLGMAICKAVIASKWGDEIPDEIWENVK